MDTADLLEKIKDRDASEWSRIEAIEQLRAIRFLEKRQPQPPGVVLSEPELSGKSELEDLMRVQEGPVIVRCQAAAVLADTDNHSVLRLCNEMIGQHLEARNDDDIRRDSNYDS
jgi:hypothetical protein